MKSAFTILEVLVSLAMISILVVSVFPIVGWLNSRIVKFQYDSEAATILQEGTEAAYNYFLSLDAWSDFSTADYYLAVDSTSGQKKWTLLEGGRRDVGGRFKQWIKIVPVCRDITTGKILWTGSGTSRTIDCSDPATTDDSSRMLYSFVAWNEPTGAKQINSELLIVDL